jgi:hypothetical protein
MTARSYQRGCLAKKRYESKVDALVRGVASVRRGAPPLKAYECRHCHGWHLTKKVGPNSEQAIR